jgi:hypothetical protein
VINGCGADGITSGLTRQAVQPCVRRTDMSQRLSPEDLGEPALRVAGFQLWIHGRQFPEAEDYDDGNWLRVTAHCGGSGASVWAQGAIVMVPDISGFGKQCEAMLRGDSSSAVLDPYEPELKVSLEATDRLGHIRAQVEITPDHLTQSHKMSFNVDQSYLPGIIKQCSAIVQEYQIRGIKDRKGV